MGLHNFEINGTKHFWSLRAFWHSSVVNLGAIWNIYLFFKIPVNLLKTQTWCNAAVCSCCWLPSTVVMTNSCREFKRHSGLLTITWRDRRYPSELGQRRSDHCTCLTEGGQRPHLVWHTHRNARSHVLKLYTSTNPGDKASNSGAIWPRLNALQCNNACSGKPSKVWHFSTAWVIQKGKNVCTLLSKVFYFMESIRPTGY